MNNSVYCINEEKWIAEFERELNRQLNSQEIEFVRWLSHKTDGA